MGGTSIATKIAFTYCGHSVIADARLMDAIDRAMATGESARSRMRCTKCQQKNATIDFCATGDFYSDNELEEFASNAESERDYTLATLEFLTAKDKYEPLLPLGFDKAD
jgi:hypothetical protein